MVTGHCSPSPFSRSLLFVSWVVAFHSKINANLPWLKQDRKNKGQVPNSPVVPAARKIDERSNRPDSCRLRPFSNLVSDFRSMRPQYRDARREIDSAWYPASYPTAMRLPAASSHPPRDGTFRGFPTLETFNLYHRPITRMDLRWDLVKPLSTSRVSDRLDRISFLDGPALGPHIFSAQIRFRESRLWRLEQLWGPIVVQTKRPGQPITLRHVFDAIANYFQGLVFDFNHGVTAAALRSEDVVDSWRQRNYDTFPSCFKRSPWMQDPFIRRVDFLLGFSLFRKLRLGSISGQSCNLVLSIQ
jgi:hypothetical protein